MDDLDDLLNDLDDTPTKKTGGYKPSKANTSAYAQKTHVKKDSFDDFDDMIDDVLGPTDSKPSKSSHTASKNKYSASKSSYGNDAWGNDEAKDNDNDAWGSETGSAKKSKYLTPKQPKPGDK